jgi:hypothetical protein
MPDGIYRANQRGDSLRTRGRAEVCGYPDAAAVSAAKTLLRTRAEVVKGWQALRKHLTNVGYDSLAEKIERFTREMPPVRTVADLNNEQSRSGQSSPSQHITEKTR